ncbi:PP2C family protein-serine/threonine phosphatase [Streptomyces acidicola]|uniref:Serine/threonine-protein phosphatase n=1 Tax=Streptomyces acidicola TaxID=2596892 RepID=A0A5N8X630_9ACTN|nr:PP2C family protein-serine/threonine phosphatase [Streptomyces acidicola]MPY54909.1 serine/threonine-protein phosphatase [Streptomyces acidicola]
MRRYAAVRGRQRPRHRARRSLLDRLDRLPRLGPAPDPAEQQGPLRLRGRSIAWVPPLALLVAVPVLDLLTAGDFRVISWVVLVPGISAAVCRVWTTAVFAVLAVVAYVLFNVLPGQIRTGLADFILVVVGGLLSVLACSVRVRGERRMLHMRNVVETTVRTLLRPLPPGWGGLDHAAVYLSADSEARVGGDFYDIQPGLHGTRVLLGDVQGKGLGAVEAAAALLGTFREAAYHEARLSAVAERLEVRMTRHVGYCADVGREDGDRFATAVLVGFPTAERDRGLVEVVNFGHEPPLLVAPGGVRALPPGDGLPLGLGDLVDASLPPVRTMLLAPDETLLLVTDGVTEARGANGEFFPLQERLARVLLVAPGLAKDPGRLVRLVRDGTLEYCGGRLEDDTTIFAVRRRGRA